MNSFNKGLYIVSTPIGNLDDISVRAIETFNKSDIILCEDTRHSIKLLNHYKIKKKLISYHKFNEKKELTKIIEYLKQGKILSLISDAGTPALSDPGNLLIKECIKQNISVFPIPGASSITTAMSISGFNHQFIFYGFLPKTEKELDKILKNLSKLDFSVVFFLPAVKINFYLKAFKKYFNEREILIAREMTKLHESFYRGLISEIKIFTTPLKGELTIVISKKNNKDNLITEKDVEIQAKKYLKKYSLKDVVELVSKKENIAKKKVYKICLKIKKNEENN
jgi:16S rRNA (cytidine1402-2'-O)-methyltransferase|tara:strand:- start:415 stop:1257 length:843 start_codon:yes stop_codon:yes gene_type:complete